LLNKFKEGEKEYELIKNAIEKIKNARREIDGVKSKVSSAKVS
jgi:hypothetical protein